MNETMKVESGDNELIYQPFWSYTQLFFPGYLILFNCILLKVLYVNEFFVDNYVLWQSNSVVCVFGVNRTVRRKV